MNPNPEVALQEAILAGRKEHTDTADTFWASGIGFCPRKQIGQRAGLPPTEAVTMHAQFKMSTGTVLGRWVSDLLIQQGYCDPAWTEKRLVLGSYSGRPDGYTPHINGGAIVEVKTADDRAITKPDWPEHYEWQLMWYCLAAGVETGVLLQIGKNQGLSRHRVLHLDEGWKKLLTNHMAYMDEEWAKYQQTGALPPCNHRFAFEDRWCPYVGKEYQLESIAEEGIG